MTEQPAQVSGAQSLIKSLEAAGASNVFGIPGGAILPAYDPLFDSVKLRHILVRHEQGAGHMDSVPIVAVTGQVASGAIGTDAFQEADIRGITMPITKHNFLVTDAAEIPQRIAEAFHLAATGRPGAVLVDIA